MSSTKSCPACGGKGRKLTGKVVLLPTHRTYGYGEHTYVCRRCGEGYSVFYAIPPKSGALPPKPDKPDDGLLRPGWVESVTGHAAGVVAGVDIPSETEPEDAAEVVDCTED